MLKICRYLSKKEISQLFLVIFFIVSQVWFDLKLPDYMADITRQVETPGSQMSEVWKIGAKMLLISFLSLTCAVLTSYFAVKVASSFSQHLRSLQFAKVESFSPAELGHFSTASLITRSTNDVTQVQMFLTMGLMMLIKAPIMAVWAVLKIAGKGFEWTLSTAVAVAVLMVIVGILMVFVMPRFKRMQTLTDNINLVARENLTGLRVVRAYNAEDYQEAKFDKANKDLTDTQLSTTRAMSIMMPMMTTIMNGLMLAVYWIGAYLINEAGLKDRVTLFGNMVVFSSYAVQVIMSFLLMSMVFVLWPRADVSANRIMEVLDTKSSITDGTKSCGLSNLQGQVAFQNVSFTYPGASAPILEDISFTVEQGQTTAFIGSTGSGKSTLVNLVPRFADVSAGKILVDGVDVRDYEIQALRDKIGYVPQQSYMFRGTVESNVAYGDQADGVAEDEKLTRVKEAIDIAQAEEFVSNMPDTYHASIAQGGSNVSGGQKQRLSIARAVWRKPEILIFDDSFSALDFKTDRVVRHELKKRMKGTTMLIVAQRIGTIMDADQIVVLEQGRIVGKGTHRELLKTCEVYQQIAKSQLTENELTA